MTLRLALGLDTGSLGTNRDALAALAQQIDGGPSLVTIEDGFATEGNDGLDALALANWLGARTRTVGIVAGAAINHVEPFHVSTAIATLDYVTQGRAGVLVQRLAGERVEQAQRAIGALNGFPPSDPATLDGDRAEAIEVVRRLWDSWEDDAVIRDPVSQRFVDGDKLHRIEFEGTRFSVLGPSITPRPPQGQLVVATTLRPGDDPRATAGADVVFLGAPDEAALSALIGSLTEEPRPLLFADILLSFDRRVHVDRPALPWTGTAEELAAQLRAWDAIPGLAGLRLIPADPRLDLELALPSLRSRDSSAGSLRERLGLPPALNRYVPHRPVAA